MRSSDETDADGVGFGILEIWDGGDEGGCEDVEGVPTCSFGEFEVDEREGGEVGWEREGEMVDVGGVVVFGGGRGEVVGALWWKEDERGGGSA